MRVFSARDENVENLLSSYFYIQSSSNPSIKFLFLEGLSTSTEGGAKHAGSSKIFELERWVTA